MKIENQDSTAVIEIQSNLIKFTYCKPRYTLVL